MNRASSIESKEVDRLSLDLGNGVVGVSSRCVASSTNTTGQTRRLQWEARLAAGTLIGADCITERLCLEAATARLAYHDRARITAAREKPGGILFFGYSRRMRYQTFSGAALDKFSCKPRCNRGPATAETMCPMRHDYMETIRETFCHASPFAGHVTDPIARSGSNRRIALVGSL